MSAGTAARLDERLLAALRSERDLPGDLAALGDCLQTVGVLLAEKASELEPSWGEARAIAAEIETLLTLEDAIAERACAIRAGSLGELRAKFAILRALDDGGPAADAGAGRDRLIRSIGDDLDRL